MESTLGNIIKTARENAGLSQRELAHLCNISNFCICKIEHEQIKSPSFGTLIALSQVLNLDLELLKEKAGYASLPISVDMTLSELIKNARLSKNICQQDLADLCNVSRQYVNLLENNPVHKPRLLSLVPFSKHLGIELSLLIEKAGYSDDYLKKNATLAELVCISRALVDLTQAQLAQKVGICRSRISDIETGLYKKPKLSTLEALSKSLDLDLAILKKKAGYP